ncbi:hypothetical protein CALCODRAFT_488486 [Calocera cornea HHB12733]|uniref:Uncharacterized protein n=1 Tax=Calocera cornea HHB12733 TaxID=1353952 RepID=A0A165CFX6_9BASI|nr:hypothetical protein CALCODRAFT_488486 [Calocera cornea HHB12733]
MSTSSRRRLRRPERQPTPHTSPPEPNPPDRPSYWRARLDRMLGRSPEVDDAAVLIPPVPVDDDTSRQLPDGPIPDETDGEEQDTGDRVRRTVLRRVASHPELGRPLADNMVQLLRSGRTINELDGTLDELDGRANREHAEGEADTTGPNAQEEAMQTAERRSRPTWVPAPTNDYAGMEPLPKLQPPWDELRRKLRYVLNPPQGSTAKRRFHMQTMSDYSFVWYEAEGKGPNTVLVRRIVRPLYCDLAEGEDDTLMSIRPYIDYNESSKNLIETEEDRIATAIEWRARLAASAFRLSMMNMAHSGAQARMERWTMFSAAWRVRFGVVKVLLVGDKKERITMHEGWLCVLGLLWAGLVRVENTVWKRPRAIIGTTSGLIGVGVFIKIYGIQGGLAKLVEVKDNLIVLKDEVKARWGN